MSAELVERATRSCALVSVTDDKQWTSNLRRPAKNEPNAKPNRLVVVDNAESAYFIQSLADISTEKFAELRGEPALYQLGAERFVRLCRTDLQRCLFLVFTNNMDFALGFEEAVNDQHKGLVEIAELPLPAAEHKETIIRVNTNRLNRISYWYCLDRAGPEAKQAVYSALIEKQETFPATFKAVDSAIREAPNLRAGRPANKCNLSLVVLGKPSMPPKHFSEFSGAVDTKCLCECLWLGIWKLGDGWARACLPEQYSDFAALLLESEWQLQLVYLGRQFVGTLLDDSPEARSACAHLLSEVTTVPGHGTPTAARGSWTERIKQLVKSWRADVVQDEFWEAGQVRAGRYEAALRAIYPSYNTGGPGFLQYRPDLVLEPYVPCSLVSAQSDDVTALNDAIKRRANVVEFTAQKEPTANCVTQYLSTKLPNYLKVVQNQ